jgi:hypothetical protein
MPLSICLQAMDEPKGKEGQPIDMGSKVMANLGMNAAMLIHSIDTKYENSFLLPKDLFGFEEIHHIDWSLLEPLFIDGRELYSDVIVRATFYVAKMIDALTNATNPVGFLCPNRTALNYAKLYPDHVRNYLKEQWARIGDGRYIMAPLVETGHYILMLMKTNGSRLNAWTFNSVKARTPLHKPLIEEYVLSHCSVTVTLQIRFVT